MKGKCNCGNKAVAEYLVYGKKEVSSIKLCEDCKPKLYWNIRRMTLIDGK